MTPPTIEPWAAIGFALQIDDHYDRLEFLQAALEGATAELAEHWPEFQGVSE